MPVGRFCLFDGQGWFVEAMGSQAMLVTDLAMRDMSERSDAVFQRICRWLMSPFHIASGTSQPAAGPEASNSAHSRPTEPHTATQSGPIDLARHRAASAGSRALLLAGSNRFDEARSAFYAAMVADPRLDPGSLPGFWDLPRRGMFAAIEACEDLGRYRDAAALEVRILQASRSRIVVLRSDTPATATR